MQSRFTLTGTVSLTRNTNSLIGQNTLFNTELRAGDVLEVPTGANSATEKIVIESVTDNTTATYFCIQGGAVVNTSNTTRLVVLQHLLQLDLYCKFWFSIKWFWK